MAEPAVRFQRARTEEQRGLRRQAILVTATGMLNEMPVRDVSLNELARRTGLAKSAVLRYFNSREAVLLELLHDAVREWLAALSRVLTRPDRDVDMRTRATNLINALTESLCERPVLCDLLSAQAAVLERNLSAAAAARYKQDAFAAIRTLSTMISQQLNELGRPQAERLSGAILMVTGAVWSYSHPSGAMLTAYEAGSDQAAPRMNFERSLRDMITITVTGVLNQPQHL